MQEVASIAYPRNADEPFTGIRDNPFALKVHLTGTKLEHCSFPEHQQENRWQIVLSCMHISHLILSIGMCREARRNTQK